MSLSNPYKEATDQLLAIQRYLDELEGIRQARSHNHQDTANEALLDTAAEVEELHRQVASTLHFTRQGVQA